MFAIPIPNDFGTRKLTWTIVANGQTTSVSFWMNAPYFIDFFKNKANGNEPPIVKFAPDGPTMTGPPRGIAQTLRAAISKPLALTLWASDQPATYNPPELGRGAAGSGRGADDPGRGTARGADASVAIVGGQIIRGGGVGGGGGGRGRIDEGPPGDIIVNWKLHRAPAGAEVTFDDRRIPLQNKGDAKLFLQATTNAKFSAPGEYVLRAQVNDQSGDGGGGDQCCWTTAFVKVTIK